MFKKMSQVKWEEARKKLVSLGIQVITDVEPKTTVSGYINGQRFSICWLDGTSTCTLEIEKLINSVSPIEDPLVSVISEFMLESDPFIFYENRNRKGYKLLEWRRKELQKERIAVLNAMKDISELKDLNQ